MVALGLKWMLQPESPFYISPRLDRGTCCAGAGASAERRRRCTFAAPRRCCATCTWPAARGIRGAGGDGGDFGLAKGGLLMLCRSRHGAGRGSARSPSMRSGWACRREVARCPRDRRARARHSHGCRRAACSIPLDCQLDPAPLHGRAAARTLQRLGVEFFWQTEAHGWRHAQGGESRRSTTDRQANRGGRVRARRRFVVAALGPATRARSAAAAGQGLQPDAAASRGSCRAAA